MSPSGCHWRCAITPRQNILRIHGAQLHNEDHWTACYTSGQKNKYFGWQDATHDTVQQLAQKFMERFPEIVEASKGDDWNYAGWYVRMLGYADQGFFPIAYSDCRDQKPDPRFLPLLGKECELPMPPSGDAEAGRAC